MIVIYYRRFKTVWIVVSYPHIVSKMKMASSKIKGKEISSKVNLFESFASYWHSLISLTVSPDRKLRCDLKFPNLRLSNFESRAAVYCFFHAL